MAYPIKLIGPSEKDRRIGELRGRVGFQSRADIHGVCVELLTDEEEFKEMWKDNFRPMEGRIQPHCTVVALKGEGEFSVEYEPATNTAFLFNCDYYGYVKSIALSAAGDVLEERSISKHDSVHGSLVDVDGRGLALIGPSGVGKTTHSYGLLMREGTSLVADDWFFVELAERPLAYASERRSYVRSDIGDFWEKFRGIVENAEKDNAGRAIVDVSDAMGEERVKAETVLERIVLLKRDKSDGELVRELSPSEGMEFLKENDFCNPHLLVKNRRKYGLRVDFFKGLLSRTGCWLVNTAAPVSESQEAIREIADGMA